MAKEPSNSPPDFSKWITIFADASWCASSHAGGWGAWLKREGLERGLIVGGQIRGEASSNMAELVAIEKALKHAQEQEHLQGMEVVMVQSDCEWALQKIHASCPWAQQSSKSHEFSIANISVPAPALKVVQRIADITAGKRFLLRHIKGHSSRYGGRSWVNDQCDRMAKRHMRRLRG